MKGKKRKNQIKFNILTRKKKLKNLDRKFEVIERLAPPTPPPPYQKKVKMNETVIRSLLFWLVFFPISNTQIWKWNFLFFFETPEKKTTQRQTWIEFLNKKWMNEWMKKRRCNDYQVCCCSFEFRFWWTFKVMKMMMFK